MPPTPPTGAPLRRGLTRARPARRDVLRLAGAAAGLALAAGCGIRGQKRPEVSAAEFWDGRRRTGRLRFANWPLYMDEDRTQLAQFTDATGVRVAYDEAIQDNPSWFGRIQPILANGGDIGCDLMVVTNGLELGKLLALNYLAPLDHARLPNFAEHGADLYKDTAYDPGNTYCVPYTSGLTGIAYNPEYVDREITSLDDLWDPAFKGRVGMMRDPQEIANFGLLRTGAEPEKSGEREWQAAARALRGQREAGIVRAYYEQDYIQPLTNGDVWLTMAWSGDIFQQNATEGTDLRFVVPEEGATIWTDNMIIPFTSRSPVDAVMLMDFLYDPEVAAGLTEYINYVTPVPEAKDRILAHAEDAEGDDRAFLTELAESPLVFPTEDEYARLHGYVPLEPGEDEGFTSLFLGITQA
ncbi:spermidine/putrescine transport system substrate-binding protein [Murinocardiopsis flavida]|uniref:Spermidine/putrescine transport system substrate-binding protein n=1 Tax=Murinocardiopsis flavida TaxID=645275 RepID=A0A2P8DN02_9ACTN|nr:spermidine/putrescine ABC transporter substrate-binding protein [Murinocardiopsis flavida]PSK98592.1 spermidine/putrescine transport system substrate-binding protein [Murinocardiopsis flavida]